MKTEDICAIELPPIADNAVLLMWATYPQLEEAFKVIPAWGFTYKTVAFTWAKLNQDGSYFSGMGRYTRANPELCLLATRGKGLERKATDVQNLQTLIRGRHSEKPAFFRDEIVRLFGDVPRIELFARDKAPGWDVWGNQAPKFDTRLF
jgi:N6-adenosine-specific RNA methylase IME4